MPDTTPDQADAEADLPGRRARGWLERLWATVAERGRTFAAMPSRAMDPLDRIKVLADGLLSERGEASGAALARELLDVLETLSGDRREQFLLFLAEGFQPDPDRLASAARAYLAEPSPDAAAALARAAEPPRQELLRRMNMAAGGTQALVRLRQEVGGRLRARPVLSLLDADLRSLFVSWFNRGFLELKQIDWQTPAAILEKLIAYEAVHEIHGWEDLRRRLAPDRRCFAFFHPALPGEPLIFVEVALVQGLAGSLGAVLEGDADEPAQRRRAAEADTAVFYSISNCQDGLRGISFGNFLIKQVVEDLRADLPGLRRFATLSPAPGFRAWLEPQLALDAPLQLHLSPGERSALAAAAGMAPDADSGAALRKVLGLEHWEADAALSEAARPALLGLCAVYLTRAVSAEERPIDAVARFHLGNGARLERLNWLANPQPKGLLESWGVMVNYLYDPGMIEANHEAFVRKGHVARSRAIDALLAPSSQEEARADRRARRAQRLARAAQSPRPSPSQ